MNKLLKIPRLVALLCALSAGGLAGAGSQSPQDDKSKPTNCAYSLTVLDVVAQNTPKDETIIVIARLGEGEARRELNHRRLHNVRTYLTKFLTHEDVRRDPESLILAEGERSRGYGRVEFYVRGKLFDYLSIATGADLIVGSCYHDEPGKDRCTLESDRDFYPCRDRHLRRRQRRRD